MKHFLGIILITLASTAFSQTIALNNAARTSLNANDNAVFNWSKVNHDFGKIKVNVPVTYTFTFINKGSAPLIISSVKASCGCTAAEYSKDAIAPGQQGFVKATYNAAKVGVFNKSITIHANTEEDAVQLSIKGEVIAD